ncbi:MAG: hypothetical protein KGM46_00135 [Pseudomonadota bacterium]|nr:hypothetical protein [Pseudomonadota bacterium]
MKISFVKGNGKYDRMVVYRGDLSESVDCPKQGIIPHDMVHYAVESTLHRRGFLGRVRDGEAIARMGAETESDGVERLVEVIQGDAWSGAAGSPADLLDLYRLTCRARACPPLPLACGDILAIRDRIGELDLQWRALPAGAALELEL